MNCRIIAPVCAAVAVFAGLAGIAAADPVTYQGRLDDNGVAVDGMAALSFTVWDAPTGGSLVGGPYLFVNHPVEDGLFTVTLDIDPEVLRNGGEFLEVAVNFTTLAPRQRLTSAPFSANTRGIDVDGDGNAAFGVTANPGIRLRAWNLDGGLALQAVSSSGRALEALTTNPGDPGTIVTNQDGTGWALAALNNGSNSEILLAGPDIGVDSTITIDGGTAVSGVNLATAPGSIGVYGQASGDGAFAGKFVGRGNFTGHTTIGDDTRRISTAEFFGVHTPVTGTSFGGMYISTAGETGAPFYGYSAGGGTGDFDAYHYYLGSAEDWRLWVGGDRITVERQTGEVGIGTTSPAFRLEVNGTAGKPGGGSWSNASDIRLKHNIAGLNGSLDALLSLRGVTFEYTDPEAINELPGTRIGMIAQEVETVFPDWVETAGHGFKTVTFRGFEALTVEALRELRDEGAARAETLERENEALRGTVRTLDARVRALEAMVSELIEREPAAAGER
jgi:hypothetical protein